MLGDCNHYEYEIKKGLRIFKNLFMRLTLEKKRTKSVEREAVKRLAQYLNSSTNESTTDTFELLADTLVSFHGLPGGLLHEKDMLFVSELRRQLPEQNENVKKFCLAPVTHKWMCCITVLQGRGSIAEL